MSSYDIVKQNNPCCIIHNLSAVFTTMRLGSWLIRHDSQCQTGSTDLNQFSTALQPQWKESTFRCDLSLSQNKSPRWVSTRLLAPVCHLVPPTHITESSFSLRKLIIPPMCLRLFWILRACQGWACVPEHIWREVEGVTSVWRASSNCPSMFPVTLSGQLGGLIWNMGAHKHD